MSKKRFSLSIIFSIAGIAFAVAARGQNLVVNGSFEKKVYCPSNFNQQQMKQVEHWTQPTEGTPDYFHACSDKVGVPKNMFGVETAKDGEAYVGVVCFSPGKRNYREYMQSKLERPLNAGELVCIEINMSAADFSMYVTDGIGLCITKEKIAHPRNDMIIALPAINNPKLNMLDQADGWLLLSDIYEAQGGEQYITIGNFLKDSELKILKRTKDMGATEVSQWAYVYLDDIVVRPVKTREDCSCTLPVLAAAVHDPPLELEEYEQVRLDAVLFGYDMDVLTDTARQELQQIYKLLAKNRYMHIEIAGHTDVMGSDEYNIDLSKRRAQTVIAYLEKRGIEISRLQIKYFGKSKPVADNTTDEGRAQNRRVEFQVVEKKFELVQ
ncbi:MAG: OmpA family protein [Flavobacteriales bacterium]|nr:OmpA family protein [Flavobacteriales bacterium]